MIAAIRRKGASENEPCVVYSTGRVRLHVEIRTWCGHDLETDESVDKAVLQLPDDTKICGGCKTAITKWRLEANK